MNTEKTLQTTSLKQFLREIDQVPDSKYNLSNIFSVVNKGKNSYFNLAKTLNFNNMDQIPSKYYTLYKISDGDTWTNIAYNTYRNIKPWWIICKFNDIKNPFQQLIIGKVIKLPTQELLDQIADILNS